MSFVVQLARRELRSSWRRMLFFFVCIGVGVGSIVALRSMIRNLNRAVAGEARALMTADAQVETTREWDADALAKIERVARPPLEEEQLGERGERDDERASHAASGEGRVGGMAAGRGRAAPRR